MKPIRLAFIAVSLLAAIAGLIAAWYWLRASRVPIELPDFQPVERDLAQDDWIAAIADNITRASELNAKAARWTAVAVTLGAIAAVLSVI